MPTESLGQHTFRINLGEADYARLAQHATRLAFHRNVLAQIAVHEKLIRLDEELAFELAQKSARRSKRVGEMGSLPGGMGSAGMPIAHPLSPQIAAPLDKIAEPKVLEKLDRSFRSYFEYVEQADGPIQRSMRIDRVLDDMRTRATDAEANVAFVEFQDKLAQRERQLSKTVIKTLPAGVPISGDLETETDAD